MAKKFKSLWKQLDFWLSPIKTILDILIIIIIVLSLKTAQDATKAAQDANELSKQAISSNYTPWIKLVNFSIDDASDTTQFLYTLKNFSSNGLALNLKIRSLMPNPLNENYSFTNEVLMPGEEGTLNWNFATRENIETINAIKSGRLPVRIQVSYNDRFGHSYIIEQEIRNIGKIFRMVEYKIKEPSF